MKMEVHLTQRLEQRMQLSQQMLQNLELLQLPLLQLRQKIDEELEANPALELSSELEERVPESVQPDKPAAETAVEESKREFLESVEEEWFQSERRTIRGGSEESDKKFEYLQNVGAPSKSLRDHLRTQIALIEIDEAIKPYLELLINHINDNGYIVSPLEEIAQSVPDELKKVAPEILVKKLEMAVSFLQKLDPRGVGARSIKECLLLQLDESDANFAAKRRLVDRHLEDIGNNRLPKMVREICNDNEALVDFGYKPGTEPDVIMDDIKILIGELQKLNPKPGGNHSSESTPRVFPEVLIRKVDGIFEIVIEDSYLPPLSVNKSYQEMLKDKGLGKVEKDYIRRKLDAGRKLISAIEQRRSTIQRITAEILKHQMEFFESGADFLKPLKMQEVADAVGIHVSTVSRAISGKWIETPRGIFPLKFFFATAAPKQVPTIGVPVMAGSPPAGDDDRTRLALMDKIREIIDGEDPKNPLSDLEIVKILKNQVINAARRTIAKYREEMNIPSSRLRRKY